MSAHVLAVVTITAKEGQQDAVAALLIRMNQAALGDEGTVQHTVCRHAKDPRRFVMVEQFADDTAFALHQANDTLNSLGAELGALVDDLKVTRTVPLVG